MKMSDVKVMSPDQVKDEVLKLKKEQFNLRFQRARARSKTHRASARSAVTSPVSRRRSHWPSAAK